MLELIEGALEPAFSQVAPRADDVDADIKEARLLGVSGVPFFVIDDRYGVSGAQPVDVFRQVLAHAWANRVTAS